MSAHKKVMIVDDEESVRVSFNRYLSSHGFDVLTVEDGGDAISRLRAEAVDVVVADLKMPRVDGMELLRWMHDERPDTPFILLTGYGNDEVERISGKVEDQDGNPIEGVLVTAISPDMDNFAVEKTTNKKGNFVIGFSDSGISYVVELKKQGNTLHFHKVTAAMDCGLVVVGCCWPRVSFLTLSAR